MFGSRYELHRDAKSTWVDFNIFCLITLANPKPATLTLPFESERRISGIRSQWSTIWWWQLSTPEIIYMKQKKSYQFCSFLPVLTQDSFYRCFKITYWLSSELHAYTPWSYICWPSLYDLIKPNHMRMSKKTHYLNLSYH